MKRPAGSRERPPEPSSVPVGDLLGPEARTLGLRLVAGRAGLDRQIQLSRIQRPGLALTGYTDYLRYGRVQVLGSGEVSYLATLTPNVPDMSSIGSSDFALRVWCTTSMQTPGRALATPCRALTAS